MAEKKTTSTIERVSALIEEQSLTKEQLLDYLRQVMEIRALENNISNLLGRDVLKGASHLYAGQEAVAVGAVSVLRSNDLITSTHRGHGHAHAHGDSAAEKPDEKQMHYNKMMAEVMGKSGGYCKGKGGSMHIADVAHGNLGATGIVGGNIPVAVGAALAQKLMGTDKVVLCFFGDGASNTGNFHESLNMASLWDLPVVFVVENNLYAMSVPWAKASKLPNVADRACAYGIPGEVVKGENGLIVRVEDMLSGELREIEVDLVILATGVRPRKGIEALCEMMSLERDEYGFIKVDAITPSKTNVEGVFVCGMGSGPKDVPDTVASGGEAASRCMEYVSEGPSS